MTLEKEQLQKIVERQIVGDSTLATAGLRWDFAIGPNIGTLIITCNAGAAEASAKAVERALEILTGYYAEKMAKLKDDYGNRETVMNRELDLLHFKEKLLMQEYLDLSEVLSGKITDLGKQMQNHQRNIALTDKLIADSQKRQHITGDSENRQKKDSVPNHMPWHISVQNGEVTVNAMEDPLLSHMKQSVVYWNEFYRLKWQIEDLKSELRKIKYAETTQDVAKIAAVFPKMKELRDKLVPLESEILQNDKKIKVIENIRVVSEVVGRTSSENGPNTRRNVSLAVLGTFNAAIFAVLCIDYLRRNSRRRMDGGPFDYA